MKQFIKDGKIYNSPIRIEKEGEIQITNDIDILKELGYEVYENKVTLTPEEQKYLRDELINQETDAKILNDFVWNGNEFYLTMENQFNFKNLYDLREMKSYPVTIKTKTGFIELQNKEEVADFYLAGVNFVEKCIKDGWAQKEKIVTSGRRND